jgi:hypothetical protein
MRKVNVNWAKLLLFTSGLFFGGAIDHALLVVLRREETPYGFYAGIGANAALAAVDLGLALLLYMGHRRLETRMMMFNRRDNIR